MFLYWMALFLMLDMPRPAGVFLMLHVAAESLKPRLKEYLDHYADRRRARRGE